MRPLARLRPSPAMVVACLALAVALSGAGYAAVVLPRNSVGTPQLRTGAVISAKVRDRSLRAVDFARGQLPAGPTGLQGPPGVSGREVVRVAATVAPGTYGGLIAPCPAGKTVLGGGVNTANSTVPITTSRPEGDGWNGRAFNGSTGTVTVETYAVCATVS